MNRISEERIGSSTRIVIAPSRDAGKALWLLALAALTCIALVRLWTRAVTANDLGLWIAVPSFVIGAFFLIAVSEAYWTWTGVWRLDIGDTEVSVQALLLGKTWQRHYDRHSIAHVRVQEFSRKGNITGYRIVAERQGKPASLTPRITEQEAHWIMSRMTTNGLA